MQNLKIWFEKAGLPIKIERNPISKGVFASISNPNTFQLTIDSHKSKNTGQYEEYFRMYMGCEDNDVRVIDYDAKKQQMLLLIKEYPNRDTTNIGNSAKEEHNVIKAKTPEFMSKYLMGKDESHLFISELPSDLGLINKVKDAHRILKPEYVKNKEKNCNRIKRQGEWFFIPIDSKEQTLIDKNKDLMKKKVRIGNNVGNPHIADCLLRIKVHDGKKKKKTITFVIGKVSHIEHKTLKLPGWFRVEQNTELRTNAKLMDSLTNKRDKSSKNVKRQGNALFVPATRDEISLMNKHKIKVRKNVQMGSGWKNAHIAEKLLCLKGNKTTKGMTLVSGDIRHKKHKTIKLNGWYKVERDPNYKPRVIRHVTISSWEQHQQLLDKLDEEERELLRIHWID